MADYRFNLWESIKNGDLHRIGDNLLGYTIFGGMLIVIPFLISGRYIRGKVNELTSDKIDICEFCIKKYMDMTQYPVFDKEGLVPYQINATNWSGNQLRCYVMSHCKICAPHDKFKFKDACTGGAQRCVRLSPQEYMDWSKS